MGELLEETCATEDNLGASVVCGAEGIYRYYRSRLSRSRRYSFWLSHTQQVVKVMNG